MGRLPDFFIVGQPKSGTTALHHMLRSHPQIFMPENKEPWFFADELHERTPPRPAGTPRSLAEYTALFAAAGPRAAGRGGVGAVPVVAHGGPGDRGRRPRRARDRDPARARQPAALAAPAVPRNLVETEPDLRSALELEPSRREGRNVPRHTYWPQALAYSEHVRYVEQLSRYSERFPPGMCWC